jgi:transposase-like protein
MPDIVDEIMEEMDREWLKQVAGRLGVKAESLRRLTKRPHVEYGDQFTADQLKPLYHILRSYGPADGRRENTVERFLRVLSDTNGIPVSTMRKWRSTLRDAPEVASPHRRNRAVSAQTLTEAQEQGLRAEIIAARTKHELVTQQCVSSRAADIYRLGLYIDGAAPPAVSQEG